MPRALRSLLAAALPAAFAAALFSPAASSAPPAARKPRVVLVGWDGADWSLLDPLLAAGKLPNLAKVLARGRSWDLASYNPMASPLIWTTIATGRSPVDHGVADFQELEPGTRTRVPISGRSRKVPAVWNLASTRGISVGVVGWWATWPAEKVNGFLVSDRASPVLFDAASLSLSPALAWPEGLSDGVRIVVKREGSPAYEDVSRALKVTRAEFDAAVAANKDLLDPVTAYRKILGSTRVHARIGLDLYDRQKPELLMVYFQGTDEIGHVLARFYPPKLSTVSEEEFRKYSGGVVGFYQEADRVLGEFAARAERDGATLVLVSDHGFKWGEDRPRFYSGVQFDTAFLWHHGIGVLVAAGPGVAPSKVRKKVSVFDVAPTLARLLGLPLDPAFEGKPVEGLGPAPGVKAAPAASWAKAAKVERLVVSGFDAAEKKAADEFTKKLISLGYLTGAEAAAVDARPADRAGTETAGSFANIGTYLRERGKTAEAITWYRKALEVNPKSPTTHFNLSVALHILDKWDESDRELVLALQNGHHDPEAAVFRRVTTYMQRFEKSPKARKQVVSFLESVVAAYPANDRYRAALGKMYFESKDCASAERVFRDLVGRRPQDVEAINVLALALWCQARTAEARSLFQRSLSLNPDQPAIREGLSQIERGGKAP